EVIATAVTDASGNYRFTQLSGPAANPEVGAGVSATGYYNVVLVLPPGVHQTTPNPQPILISAGDSHITGVNFGINQAPRTSTSPTHRATAAGVHHGGQRATWSAWTAQDFLDVLGELDGSA